MRLVCLVKYGLNFNHVINIAYMDKERKKITYYIAATAATVEASTHSRLIQFVEFAMPYSHSRKVVLTSYQNI